MFYIYFFPDEKKIEINTKETILQVSLQAGVSHTHVCGGKARCSTCSVVILEGLENCSPPSAKEQAMAERLHFGPTIRLACQTTISGNVKLRRLVLDDEDVTLAYQLSPSMISGSVGEEKEVAILFCDIRGFTAFAESLVPYDVIYVLNCYFLRMGRVITRNNGYIDNYMGDGFLALFGVEDSIGAALQSVKAALEMIEEMGRLNQKLSSLFKRDLQIGIGIHYGKVVVGMMGASGKKRETAIGDAVNFASRIEEMNKKLRTNLLISKEICKQVKEQVRLGKEIKTRIKGKSSKYTLYEAIGLNKWNKTNQ